MGNNKPLSSLRDGDEFVNYAVRHGAQTRPGKGSHTIVSTPKGTCVVPVGHTKELGKGLRSVIVKTFVAIGLGIAVFVTISQFGLI